jgi:RNA ligase (TIGR02306 family)
MSTHKVDVVTIDNIEKHPNADTLEIIKIYGFTVVVKQDQWKIGDKGFYIQPDSVVITTRPEFAFLAVEGKDTARIKVKKLRGIYSQGLLIPAPSDFVGDDAAEYLQVTHYEPPIGFDSGLAVSPPKTFAPTYDIENYNRFTNMFEPGEEVIVTEKIHGQSGRAAYIDDAFHCGTRNIWKKESPSAVCWRVLNDSPQIKSFLKDNPDCVIYGEIYGEIIAGKKYTYGVPKNAKIAIFDILKKDRFLDWDESQDIAKAYNLPWVPLLYRGEFDEPKLRALAEGKTTMPNADNIREGIVIKPVKERRAYDLVLGRTQLKIVGNGFLEND